VRGGVYLETARGVNRALGAREAASDITGDRPGFTRRRRCWGSAFSWQARIKATQRRTQWISSGIAAGLGVHQGPGTTFIEIDTPMAILTRLFRLLVQELVQLKADVIVTGTGRRWAREVKSDNRKRSDWSGRFLEPIPLASVWRRALRRPALPVTGHMIYRTASPGRRWNWRGVVPGADDDRYGW